MTGIEMRFNRLGSDTAAVQVIVDVLDADLEPAVRPRSVTLERDVRLDVAPGTYLARVRFPSGEVIRQTCTVSEGHLTPVDIDIHALSGHESLERPAILSPLVRDETTAGLEGDAFATAWVRRWHHTAAQPWSSTAFDGVNEHRDAHTVRYRFALDRSAQRLQVGGPNVGWRFVTLPPNTTVDVTIAPRLDGELAISVTTRSEQAEALLGYLRAGAVEGAETIAERLLQQKMSDPIAAAIGGYYLLRVGQLKRLTEWGQNLSAWFPWLADGPVINGWRHVHDGRRGDGDPNLHFGSARSEFLRAAERGLPVYTEGLRLLVDGLRLVNDDTVDDDAPVRDALDRVELYARCADWSATTVTYDGELPHRPSASRQYGVPTDMDDLALLQHVRLQDLVDLGWIRPGARLIAGKAREATATVTSDGELDVDGIGTFESPEHTASPLGIQEPSWAWWQWHLASPGATRPTLLKNVRLQGRLPSLGDVRNAALGEWNG